MKQKENTFGWWKQKKVLLNALKNGEIDWKIWLKENFTRKKVLIWSAVSVSLFILLFGIFILTVYLGWWGIIPNRADLRRIRTVTATEIISSDNKVIGRIYQKNRTTVSLNEISPYVINALIATEDARFYEHKGVDQRSLLRVVFKSLLMGDRSAGGGSTLSQQLAKNLFPRVDHGIFTMPVAKVREAFVATRIEKLHTKDEILDLYLNTVPLGEDTYGIEAASQRFFYKHASKLSLEEAAVLVGMLKSPYYYNPRIFPNKSVERRNVVIAQMAKYGFITNKEADEAQLRPLELDYHKDSQSDGLAPYMREKIRQDIDEWLSKHPKADGSTWDLYNDGLKIYVTLDSRLQTYAENAVKKHMSYLQKQFDNHWSKQNPWGNDNSVVELAVERSDHYQQLKKAGASDAQIRKVFEEKVRMRIWDWNGEKVVNMSPLDSVKHYLKFLNCGFMAMDPRSGQVLAWVGGINHHFFKYDHVTSKRQVGSLIKPIVYLSALMNGVSPFQYYKNEQKVYADYNNWTPRNADNVYENYYSMEGALANSINTISVEMLMNGGIGNTVRLARKMGVKSRIPEYPSLALGSTDISLQEMIEAFGVFANRGSHVEPHYLVKVTD
ncbi:MAG: transglycosylase domain-containing protein, partial [Bacteroidota bacterium]|nr:transglycosylase domain-containing protein [Bacteroidota bacterium]